MPRKTWSEKAKADAVDDKKAALSDYEKTEKELREKTLRLQALRAARDAEAAKAAEAKGPKKAPRKASKTRMPAWKAAEERK